MNEILFLSHLIIVLIFAWGALKLGKEALISWVALQAVLANLFVIKQTSLFGFTVTCSDVYAIGSVLGLNLIQEYFGQESAKRAAWICFFVMIFFALMAGLHLIYIPSSGDATQASFLTVLSATPRLLIASLLTFLIVQQLDVRLYGWTKNLMPSASFPFRNTFTLIISQLLDTSLFTFLGLYGLVTSAGDILLFSFLIKLLIIFVMMPALSLLKRWVYD
ncbi:MAG: queuosine precursor transporter [Chlamydiales bacterium]|nr:queuosine precursor transporter [Chlamydiales bacterium]